MGGIGRAEDGECGDTQSSSQVSGSGVVAEEGPRAANQSSRYSDVGAEHNLGSGAQQVKTAGGKPFLLGRAKQIDDAKISAFGNELSELDKTLNRPTLLQGTRARVKNKIIGLVWGEIQELGQFAVSDGNVLAG